MVSHPFQEGVGGRDESTFPKRGRGTVMSHPKGETREEGGSTNHSQGEGVGGQIMLMCGLSTININNTRE